MGRQDSIRAAGAALAASRVACSEMTPREQAEAAYTPTGPYSVAELEALIRAERGMEPRARSA